MSPRERFHHALDLEASDRIPLFYQHLGAAKWLQRSTGTRIFDGFHDPSAFTKLALAAYHEYGFDNVMAGWGDIIIEAQAHGTEWKFPERDFYPRVSRYVPMEEIDRIRPVDPLEDRFWSVPLKAARMMMEEVGREVAVVGCINSPTVVASETVGMENLLMGYFTEPDGIHKLLATLTESSRIYGERLADIGVEDIFIENAMAGAEMVSHDMYDQFDRKYIKDMMGAYDKSGLRVILHNCSAQPFWESQLELRPSALHLNLPAVDVSAVFAAVRGKACMMAGIDHMDLMFQRSPDEVEANVREVIERWGDHPGFIIAPGCEMPYKTPRENIARLRESVERYSRRA